MNKKRKNKIDSLWNNTRVWKYVMLLAEGNIQEAEKLYNYVPKNYKGTSVEVNMKRYEFDICRNLLLHEFDSWEDYIDYIKTFSKKVVDILYNIDLFDSFMASYLESFSLNKFEKFNYKEKISELLKYDAEYFPFEYIRQYKKMQLQEQDIPIEEHIKKEYITLFKETQKQCEKMLIDYPFSANVELWKEAIEEIDKIMK